jgi:hypothetical protein
VLLSISFVSLFEIDGENPAEVSPVIQPNCRKFQLLLVDSLSRLFLKTMR